MRVSIVVPALNEADTITTSLRWLRQAFAGCELLLVDGAAYGGEVKCRWLRVLGVWHRPRRGRGW